MIEIYSDIICPWCYIGKVRFEKALENLDANERPDVIWRPFQLNPGMPVDGISRREYRTKKFGTWEHSQELDAQVIDAAKGEGLDFNFEISLKTPNTVLGHKLIKFAELNNCQDAVVTELFDSYFCEGKDIGDKNILLQIATRCGLGETETIKAFDDPNLANLVKEEEEHGRKLGISSVPVFVLNDQILFSGALQPNIIVDKLKSTAIA